MKLHKVYVIDGIPAEEFYELNADPITLFQNGDYELLHRLYESEKSFSQEVTMKPEDDPEGLKDDL